jgi:hypothetical protein
MEMKVKIIDEKIQKSIDELVHKVYERGYDDGYKVIPSVYQDNYEKGMSEIWEYIKRLGKLTINDMREIFGEGYDNIYLIAYAHTPSEFIAKIKQYEEKQKAPSVARACSILEDNCPYIIECEECEVHCSIERARKKLKESK